MAGACPGSSGREAEASPGQDTIPPAEHSHTPPHAHWDNAGAPGKRTCTSLGCERKPEDQERAHADTGNAQTPHRQGPAESCFFFYLVNIIMK